MPEYIVKEQALEAILSAIELTGEQWAQVWNKIKQTPAADVVEVVRCKDCKYKSMESGEFDGLEPACRFWTDADAIYPVFVDVNGFCSEGKRKEGGESE